RGLRIELGEIEAALARQPAVKEAAVLVAGEALDDRRLVAYVVAAGDPAPGVAALQSALRRDLPEHMVPAAIAFLPALPLSPNGKVDRRALAQVAVKAESGRHDDGGQGPRTATEELLAGLWCDLLDVGQVGSDDSFFQLGGHSLLATRLISRMGGAFGVELPLAAIFAAPTLAGLSARIDAARAEGQGGRIAPPIVPVPRGGEIPLSFSQERFWFFDQLSPGSSLYDVFAPLEITGRLEVAALLATIATIHSRHEGLRTSFGSRDGRPYQRFAAPGTMTVPVVDLTAVAGAPGAAAERERLIERELRWPFDLARGPLFRAELLRLGLESSILFIGMPHIVSDGWSIGLLTNELAAHYGAFVAGRPSPLPELPVQYADYAVWQRQWLQGEVLEAEIDHWRQALAGAPLLLDLPLDRPRPPVQSHRGADLGIELPEELRAALKALSSRQGVTLFMTLLASLFIVLRRMTGQDDLLIGSPIANRSRREVEGVIGCFINSLVMRGRVLDDAPFVQLLEQVKTTALTAYTHQDLPFERIVDGLQVPRDLSFSPVFQAMLILQ
ncbi:MAG TPA: condensation domain-containing protein, partial [Thermoanaerobaculia bacterium]